MNKDVNQHLAEFQFKDYAITNIRFQVHDNDCQPSENVPLRVRLGVRIALPKDEDMVEAGGVELSCFINDDEQSKTDTFFEMEVVMRGEFISNERLSCAEMRRYLQINGVAAMFPFLRAAVANISTSSNIPTVVLPMINVSSFMKSKEPQN